MSIHDWNFQKLLDDTLHTLSCPNSTQIFEFLYFCLFLAGYESTYAAYLFHSSSRARPTGSIQTLQRNKIEWFWRWLVHPCSSSRWLDRSFRDKITISQNDPNRTAAPLLRPNRITTTLWRWWRVLRLGISQLQQGGCFVWQMMYHVSLIVKNC